MEIGPLPGNSVETTFGLVDLDGCYIGSLPMKAHLWRHFLGKLQDEEEKLNLYANLDLIIYGTFP
jgi:hypothetical protein